MMHLHKQRLNNSDGSFEGAIKKLLISKNKGRQSADNERLQEADVGKIKKWFNRRKEFFGIGEETYDYSTYMAPYDAKVKEIKAVLRKAGWPI